MSRRGKRKTHHVRGEKKAAPASLAPAAAAAVSGGRQLHATRQAGVRVTEETALSLGAVWACRRCLGEDLAKLPWGVYRRAGEDRVALPEHPVEWLLSTQANPEMSAFDFRDTVVGWACTWGNGVAEIERDYAGRPHWLWPLTPDRVQPARTQRGEFVYDVANPRGPNTVLAAADTFHLKGPSFDGLWGMSVVRFAARAIGLGISLEECAANFNANDSTPGGVLESPKRLNDPAIQNLRETWRGVHGGPGRRRTVAILEEGITWKQTGLPPEDSQLIQQRQATPAEICRWFRVPPHKIADLMRGTFSNIEHQSIEYVGDALLPWARRLEAEADVKLFGPVNRGTLFTRVNLKGLLRGDTAARGAFYTSMLDRGVYSVNDVMRLEDMNPIGPDGDKRFVQANMQLLSKAGEEPPPATAPAGQAPPGQAPGEQPPGGQPPDKPGELAALGGPEQPRDEAGRFAETDGERVEREREEEDDRVLAERDKEDRAIERQRGKEDAKIERERDREDAKIEREREKEDDRDFRVQQKADDKEDAEIFDQREAEDDRDVARQEAEKEAAKDDPERLKEVEARHEQENDRVNDQREREDRIIERVREGRDADRDKAKEDRREKEDGEREARREKEDEARQARRDKEDGERFDRREKEDAPVMQKRAEEDRARGASGAAPPSAALRPVLADALARVRRRDEHRLKDAASRPRSAAWRAKSDADQRAYAREALLPPALALARLCGGGEEEAAAAVDAFLAPAEVPAPHDPLADIECRVTAACTPTKETP